MKTITVNASKNYPIFIGTGLISTLGHHVQTLGQVEKICIVSETTVWPLYGEDVTASLRSAGFNVIHYIFPAGEVNKNGTTFLELVNFLAENKLTRSDLIVALGGGVVGDLAGFTAACFLRGIRFVQIPTTLLAAVDSSVGGKTAIDLPAGKNLCGAFCQPSFVLCDINTLNTLPDTVFRGGCAEVIKYSILYDPLLFSHLEKHGLDFDLEYVITRCIELKREVVMEDEFDTGDRMKLNLGHTIGHGVEAMSNFSVSHGEAVAIGIAIVSRASVKLGLCASPTCDRIISLLKKFGLDVSTSYSADSLYTFTLSDKKRSGSTLNLIIPEAIGKCSVLPTPVDKLQSFIEAGL